MNVTEMLAEFHAAFGQSFGDGSSGSTELRVRLHEEEYTELVAALESGDRVRIAGKLADVVYVSYGTAHSLGLEISDEVSQHRSSEPFPLRTCHRLTVLALRRDCGVARWLPELVATCYALAEDHGIDLDAVVAEVHAANMRKVGPDGPVLVDGKVMKPEGWCPADVAGVLAGSG